MPRLDAVFARILAVSIVAGTAACGSEGTTPYYDLSTGACQYYDTKEQTWTVAVPPPCAGAAGGDAGGNADASDAATDAAIAHAGDASATCVGTKNDGGVELDCKEICAQPERPAVRDCAIVSMAGASAVSCHGFNTCPGGRRFEGLPAATPQLEPGELGRYFASLAYLEAASVDAFEILAGELLEHGAPDVLVRAARRAARDEVRHAKVMGALCSKYGARFERPEVAVRRRRTLEEIARENVVEGCVRETYAALVAHHQAKTASDPTIRRVMVRIAADETRHAQLSWEIARWAESALTPAAMSRVLAARDEAARDLQVELGHEPSAEFARSAGIPRGARAQAIAREMYAQLRGPAPATPPC